MQAPIGARPAAADRAQPAGSLPDRYSVLHVVAPGEVGGLERVVHALAVGQHRRGNRVMVAAVLSPAAEEDHDFLRPLRVAGVEVTALRQAVRDYAGERREVARIAREHGTEVLHTHGYRPDVVDSGVARSLGVPRVTTVHGFTGGDWKNRLYEWLQRRSFRRFDGVVAVSRPMAEHLARSGVPRRRLHVVPNAWAADQPLLDREAARRALGIESDHLRIGWVGRLSHEKGADVLLDALARCGDLPLHASFLGGGAEADALRVRAESLALGSRVSWSGPVPDAGRYFGAFDLFVLSSRTEGTPIALFEAMAAGVPVVASRVGGVPDVVSSKEARLVAPDDPGALAAAIREVVLDPTSAARRAGAASRRLHDEFRLEPWLDRYDTLYRSLRTPAR
jgi:glycosyltransferase involved in cell wall biosynthesis